MDRNQAVGFILMAALLMVYFYFFQPKPLEQTPGGPADTASTITNQAQQPIQQQTTAPSQAVEAPAPETVIDNADVENEKFGVFSRAIVVKKEKVNLENEVMNVEFSTKGGLINEVKLIEYDDYQYKNPLVLLDEKSSKVRYRLARNLD